MTFFETSSLRRRPSLLALIARALRFLAVALSDWLRERRTRRSLDRLDERMLSDIGLARCGSTYRERTDTTAWQGLAESRIRRP